MRRAAAIGHGLAAVGLVEAASNLAGDSVIDRIGDLVVANTPLPIVEQTIDRLGVTDKPFLRANIVAGLAAGIGLLAPGSRRVEVQAGLAGAGLVAMALGRAYLNRSESGVRDAFALPPASQPLPAARDGAEDWPGVELLFTPLDRFYQTDINLRPPAVDVAAWSLAVELPSGSARLTMDDLFDLGLSERDAILACVHNRPGWDRLGQQRWTGVPIGDVLTAAGELPSDPEDFDLVTGAVDGYSHVIPLEFALSERTWVVVGMAGQPLPRAHGFPARVMTPGVVGQYNGVKWLDQLRVVPRESESSWWGNRRSWAGEPGWPRGPVWVKPMARIDSHGSPGMPPRLPIPTPRLAAGATTFTGTAWAPPHGVARVEIRLDDGDWTECTLADQINGDSWRRWRVELELSRGRHTLEVRCQAADGTLQAGEPLAPFPNGSGAYHRVELLAD